MSFMEIILSMIVVLCLFSVKNKLLKFNICFVSFTNQLVICKGNKQYVTVVICIENQTEHNLYCT